MLDPDWQRGLAFSSIMTAGIDVSGDQIGHGRCVDCTQAVDAAHAQVGIEHSLCVQSHATGPRRVMRRQRGPARRRSRRRCGPRAQDLGPRRNFGTTIRFHVLVVPDLARPFEGVTQRRQRCRSCRRCAPVRGFVVRKFNGDTVKITSGEVRPLRNGGQGDPLRGFTALPVRPTGPRRLSWVR